MKTKYHDDVCKKSLERLEKIKSLESEVSKLRGSMKSEWTIKRYLINGLHEIHSGLSLQGTQKTLLDKIETILQVINKGVLEYKVIKPEVK